DAYLTAVDVNSNIRSTLVFSSEIAEASTRYAGENDGLNELREKGRLVNNYELAGPGNITQLARILKPWHFTAALGFDGLPPARGAITKGFPRLRNEYERGWAAYVRELTKVGPRFQAQFNMAAMVLDALEDKTVRGANVASLAVPWGGGANANEDVGGGYHLVWSRDLYQVVTAYMALGDTTAANRALDFLFNAQQKSDGSFPQNSWLDGKRGWGSLQMDEVGYPLILAYQLGRYDKATYDAHIKPAADFIVRTGPSTPEDRWEEKPGYSPSTIAAEIAGLVCAAEIAKKNSDDASAQLWLKTADDWQANVEKWTATTNGKYGDGHYYIRISEKGEPDGGHPIALNNNAGTFNENEIVDAGFLELVRLGIKRADDPLIIKSLAVIDQVLKADTAKGPGFYRYNHDGYGEMDDGRRWNWDGKYTGKGRLWTLLSGERGEYELAHMQDQIEFGVEPRGSVSCAHPDNGYTAARCYLKNMAAFANGGLMIPEQVWDLRQSPTDPDKEYEPPLRSGEGTGSATPLAWSMAQFIRLAIDLRAGRILETPKVVAD
ncbi:MAG TPA: glycoside hydrolase family 15 protein, partial [Pyrinomonadaceae bacterium]